MPYIHTCRRVAVVSARGRSFIPILASFALFSTALSAKPAVLAQARQLERIEETLSSNSGSESFLSNSRQPPKRLKALKTLRKLVRLRERKSKILSSVGDRAAAVLAEYLMSEIRRPSREPSRVDSMTDELDALLAPYSDFSTIAGFDYDFDDPGRYRAPKVGGFLARARWSAARPKNKDVQSAVKALAFAENETRGFDKCLALLTFAETLRDVSTASDDDDALSRAENYLDECRKYGGKFFTPVSDSKHGKARERLGTRDWRRLQDRIFRLQLDIDIAKLAAEFGPDYALYVKMRRYYDAKRWLDAFVAAERLAFGENGWTPPSKKKRASGEKNTPGKQTTQSVCAEAGRLYWCRLLLMNDAAGKYRSASLPSGVDETERFIADKPRGLYRGDALMELARFYLERKWDWKKAGVYYEKALKWFRDAREERDAVDLYALPPKLASFASPDSPETTLDEWRRTRRRKIDSKEIVNRRTAPWYVSENEKECLFMTGFLLLESGKPEEALKRFSQVSSIDKNIAFLERKNFPNALMRLRSCCKTGYIVLPVKCRRLLSRKNKCRIFLAEFKYVLEDLDAAEKIYREVLNDPKSRPIDKAAAMMGIGNCHDLQEKKTDDAEWFAKAYELSPKSAIGAESLYRLACNNRGNGKFDEAIKRYGEYLRRFPKGSWARSCLFNLAQTCHTAGRKKRFKMAAASFKKRYPKSELNKYLKQMAKTGPDEMLVPEE
ncbi:MAG: tetratricopeptide repeat protein [Kiritimatiellaeota bacterium]|nr:tetratricopeptide repeat protein [Kiritimatiellota bacterium]